MVEEFYTTKVLPHDGYFEGKFEPEKYTRLDVHAEIMEEQQIIEYANKIRKRLKQNSLGLEVDNKLILVVKR